MQCRETLEIPHDTDILFHSFDLTRVANLYKAELFEHLSMVVTTNFSSISPQILFVPIWQ